MSQVDELPLFAQSQPASDQADRSVEPVRADSAPVARQSKKRGKAKAKAKPSANSKSCDQSLAKPWFVISFGTILFVAAACFGSGLYLLTTNHEARERAEIDRLTAGAVAAVESTVADENGRGNDVDLRRIVSALTSGHSVQSCRIMLPNGTIWFDTQNVGVMPHLSTGDLEATLPATFEARVTLNEGVWQATRPIRVNDRPVAFIEIMARSNRDELRSTIQPFAATSGGAATLGLLIMGIGGQRLRKRLTGLKLIQGSLRLIQKGEKEPEALKVSAALAEEASVLNELIERNAALEVQLLEREVLGAASSPQRDAADLGVLCNVLSQGLILFSEEGRIVFANGASAIYLHSSVEELAGRSLGDLSLDEAFAQMVRDSLTGSARGAKSIDVELDTGAGTDVLRYSVRSAGSEDQRYAVVMIEDVTQQRIAEQSRSDFVSHATHELRMPLTNIRLYLETALEEGENDPKLRGQCLNVINQESQRLERVVSDMLSMSEIEAGSMQLRKDDVRLDALFVEIEHDYRAQAEEKQIAFSVDVPPKLPVIQADRDRLFVALQNLVGNAVKYTPDGGEVSVVVEADESTLTVAVKDTGIGMSEEDAARIFEKFYRADDERVRNATGTGLGLTLSQEVARLHGGEITVMSVLNEGSTFTLTLPIVTKTEG